MSDDMIQRLTEKRANVWEQAKEHLEVVEKEGREFSGEHDETWTKLNDELNGLDARIGELTSLAERNAKADEAREKYRPAPVSPEAPAETDNDVLRRMVSGEKRGGHEFRDLTKLSAGAGLNTVPTNFYATLQEHLIANSAIRQSNVTVLTTDGGQTLQVPKTTTHPTAAIIAEAGSITESDAVFGQVSLGAFKYAFSTQVSTELETDTGVDLAGYLARIGGEALGNGSGADYVVGAGTTAPWGVVPRSTLGVTGATSVAGVFTADDLIDLYYSVIAPYRANGTWMLRDSSIKTARKLKETTTGQYLWQPGLLASEPSTLLGRPVLSDPNVVATATTAKSVIFGDLSKYFIRDVKGVRVERSSDFAFQNDLITWRFILRTSGDLIDTTGAVKHFIGGAT